MLAVHIKDTVTHTDGEGPLLQQPQRLQPRDFTTCTETYSIHFVHAANRRHLTQAHTLDS